MSIEQELIGLSEDGFVRPRRVVEWAADNPTSELHSHFEWDDARAADEYRLHQARRLIAIHLRADDGGRATISLIQDRHSDGGYRFLGPVLNNAELRRMALQQALRDFRRWEARYKHLQELTRVFEEGRRAAESVEETGAGASAA